MDRYSDWLEVRLRRILFTQPVFIGIVFVISNQAGSADSLLKNVVSTTSPFLGAIVDMILCTTGYNEYGNVIRSMVVGIISGNACQFSTRT